MIVFTLCSNNYLPRARILGESLLQHNPGIRLIIGLVDELNSSIDYNALGSFEILPIEKVGIAELHDMVLRYDLVDLNTAVKPFYFRYLFKRHAGEKICYFDPDICVYSDLKPIEEALERAAVLLTPHVLTPIPADGRQPMEQAFLAFGLYNLGFCAMSRSEAADRLIDWWSEHLIKDCRYDPVNGLFVDQAWMDLAPIFFDKVEASRHPGLNAAYWNLHERQIEFQNGEWRVNNQWPLVFFHFSDLAAGDSEAITKKSSRFTLHDRPELKPLFEQYRSQLAAYNTHQFKGIPCAYVEKREKWLHEQRRLFYRRHPFRLLLNAIKRAIPKEMKALIRTS